MKLRKLDWWEVPRKTVVNVEQPIKDFEAVKKDVAWLKKRKPEYFPGGSGTIGSYHKVTEDVFVFRKNSFNPGINIIGVSSGMPTTIWLPPDLEPNHLVAVKDELGIADQQHITIRVSS